MDKCSSTQGYHCFGAAAQLLQQFLQGLVLRPAKFSFPGISEDLCYRFSSVPFNPLVEIFKAPAQLPSENSAHTTLAGAHEAHQHDCPYSAVDRSQYRYEVHWAVELWPKPSDAVFAASVFSSLLFFGAFSEMDFTTEGSQYYGR